MARATAGKREGRKDCEADQAQARHVSSPFILRVRANAARVVAYGPYKAYSRARAGQCTASWGGFPRARLAEEGGTGAICQARPELRLPHSNKGKQAAHDAPRNHYRADTHAPRVLHPSRPSPRTPLPPTHQPTQPIFRISPARSARTRPGGCPSEGADSLEFFRPAHNPRHRICNLAPGYEEARQESKPGAESHNPKRPAKERHRDFGRKWPIRRAPAAGGECLCLATGGMGPRQPTMKWSRKHSGRAGGDAGEIGRPAPMRDGPHSSPLILAATITRSSVASTADMVIHRRVVVRLWHPCRL
jgi:hypothetical protein